VAAVVYVAVAMSGPGALRHSGRGDLVIGDLPGRDRPRRDLSDLGTIFVRAGIPTVVSVDIRSALWRKLVMNCAYNAISAMTRRPYGTLVAEEETRGIIEAAVEETVMVAKGLGIDLDLAAMLDAALELGRTAMPEATSSTAQDLARGRPTEIDALNGLVVGQGEKLGIPVPVNRTLYGLVKSLERTKEN
jgi:2-dehydropantoate 2-reductase